MKNKELIITVYAIAKNEEKFVDRWYKSMCEADNIVVLDTGSTDNTVKKLKEKGVTVKPLLISPFRFDVARNESLKLIPQNTDICVCTDLDEIFEPGWREKLEKNWKENTQILKYRYVWNVLENSEDGITFLYEKIHKLNNFKWVNPVHEILQPLTPIKPDEIVVCKDIVLRHYPDPNKSRNQYLNLLELSVKEDPNNDRNTHYLAREYMFKELYSKAIKMFKKHLILPSATWKDERSASYRYIGDCYLKLNKSNLAKKAYEKAIKESFNIREPYLSLAEFYYNKKNYLNCAFVLKNMLEIKTKNLTYITHPNCWNDYPLDMLSFCYYKLNKFDLACFYAQKAILINPNNQRLKNNLKIYEECLKLNN